MKANFPKCLIAVILSATSLNGAPAQDAAPSSPGLELQPALPAESESPVIVIDKPAPEVKAGEGLMIGEEGVTLDDSTVKPPGLEPMKELEALPEGEPSSEVKVTATDSGEVTIPKWIITYPGANPEMNDFKASDGGVLTGTVRYTLAGQDLEVVSQWFSENFKANGFTVSQNIGKTRSSVTANKEPGDDFKYTVSSTSQKDPGDGELTISQRFIRVRIAK